jgi:hypothetical protein
MRRKRIRLHSAIPTLATDGVFAALATYNVPWHESVSAGVLDLMYSNHSGEKLISPAVRHGLEDGVLPESALDELAEGMSAIFGTEWQKLWATMALEYSPIENYNMEESENIDRDETRHGTDTGTRTTVTDEDTTDTGTDATQGTTTRSDTGTRATEIDEETTDTGTDNRAKSETESHSIYGFNSSQASDADETTRTGSDNETRNLAATRDATETETRNLAQSETRGDTETRNLAATRDATETETRNLASSETAGTEEERTLTRRGNIGVTTTQQMISQEREVWQWLYFEQVFKDIDKVLCLSIY